MTLARDRSAAGPFIRSRTAPLRVNPRDCYRILMRQQKPGPNHGRWEPVTTNGFVVVCPSKLEASECVWMIGGRYFPRPDWMLVENGEDSDFRYLAWLLRNHFRIEPYVKGSDPMEVWFSDFIRGWYPDAADIPGVIRGSGAAPAIESALRYRWRDR